MKEVLAFQLFGDKITYSNPLVHLLFIMKQPRMYVIRRHSILNMYYNNVTIYNNTGTIFMVLSSWLIVVARVHPVYLMNAD